MPNDNTCPFTGNPCHRCVLWTGDGNWVSQGCLLAVWLEAQTGKKL